MNNVSALGFPFLCFLILAGSPLTIQSQSSSTIHIDVDQVIVSVVVRDGSGAYVADLNTQDFRVYEDNVEQRITFFAQVDFPISVALMLDTSHSMEKQLSRIQKEAVRFVRQLREEDEVMVINFDDAVHIQNGFTVDREIIERAIRGMECGQITCLSDALGLTMRELQGKDGRKAVVLFSDGVDWGSRIFTRNESVDRAREANLIIYPVFFDTLMDLELSPDELGFRKKWYQVYLDGKALLRRLAEVSGGTVCTAAGLDDLGKAFSQIASELRSMYTLGYVSSNQNRVRDFRSIRVEVTAVRDAHIRHKRGY